MKIKRWFDGVTFISVKQAWRALRTARHCCSELRNPGGGTNVAVTLDDKQANDEPNRTIDGVYSGPVKLMEVVDDDSPLPA